MEADLRVLFGKKVKEIRAQRNMTQLELAVQINIAEQNMSKIECGKSFVTAETLSALAEALKVNIKDLFDFDCFKDESYLKNEILKAIYNNKVDIKALYKFYSIMNCQK